MRNLFIEVINQGGNKAPYGLIQSDLIVAANEATPY